MPRLPDVTDFGARPAPRPGGALPQMSGASAAGSGLEAVGRELRGLGQEVTQRQDQMDLAMAESAFLRESVKARSAVQESGDYSTWGQTYSERMKAAQAKAAEMIRNPRAREMFRLKAGDAIVRGNASVTGLMKEEEARYGRASLDELVNGNIDTAVGADDETGEELLDNINAAIDGAVANRYISPEAAVAMKRDAAQTYATRKVSMMTPEEQLDAVGGGFDTPGAASMLRRFEGYRLSPYWDVNAWRAGFGSDTVTLADGTVKTVTPDMKVTYEDAERDLERRINEFESEARDKIGPSWDAISEQTKAALVSVAYNYGEIPDRIVGAVRSADNAQIAAAVEGLAGDNGGANKTRRRREAAVIRGAEPGLAQFIPVDKRVRIAHDALRALEIERDREEKEYAAGFDDYVNALQAGAEVDPAFAARYADEAIEAAVSGAEDRVRMMAVRDEAILQQGIADAIRGATPDEVAALASGIEALTPEVLTQLGAELAPGRAQAQAALTKALQNDIAARAEDPAAYAISTDAVDPSGVGEGGERQYARAMQMEQQRLGIPPAAQRVLTKPMATEAVGMVMQAQPSERGAVVRQMEQDWGEAWPRVLRDLRGAGLDPALYHAALVADDPILSERVASLATTPMTELVKGLPETEVRDLKVSVSDELADFRSVFEAGDPTGAAAETFNELRDVATGLALQEYRRTGDAGTAVENATADLVHDRYAVLQGRRFSAYVPRDFDAAQVEDGAVTLLTDEALEKVIPFGGDEGSPEHIRNSRIRQAAKRGTFVTNSTGDGLVLMVDVDGRYVPVMTDKGPYGISFEAAQQIGQDVSSGAEIMGWAGDLWKRTVGVPF